jgi:4-coumarate--CoA ligase
VASVAIIKVTLLFQIIDEADNSLGPNKIGEIYAQQYYPFLGYINNKKATDETIDKAGWIKTGDMGYFDDDGFLFCVDRKKEIIKYCNHQVID